MDDNANLKFQAKLAWVQCKREGYLISDLHRTILTNAYWVNLLPEDNNYSVAQWVEDGFPKFT